MADSDQVSYQDQNERTYRGAQGQFHYDSQVSDERFDDFEFLKFGRSGIPDRVYNVHKFGETPTRVDHRLDFHKQITENLKKSKHQKRRGNVSSDQRMHNQHRYEFNDEPTIKNPFESFGKQKSGSNRLNMEYSDGEFEDTYNIPLAPIQRAPVVSTENLVTNLAVNTGFDLTSFDGGDAHSLQTHSSLDLADQSLAQIPAQDDFEMSSDASIAPENTHASTALVDKFVSYLGVSNLRLHDTKMAQNKKGKLIVDSAFGKRHCRSLRLTFRAGDLLYVEFQSLFRNRTLKKMLRENLQHIQKLYVFANDADKVIDIWVCLQQTCGKLFNRQINKYNCSRFRKFLKEKSDDLIGLEPTQIDFNISANQRDFINLSECKFMMKYTPLFQSRCGMELEFQFQNGSQTSQATSAVAKVFQESDKGDKENKIMFMATLESCKFINQVFNLKKLSAAAVEHRKNFRYDIAFEEVFHTHTQQFMDKVGLHDLVQTMSRQQVESIRQIFVRNYRDKCVIIAMQTFNSFLIQNNISTCLQTPMGQLDKFFQQLDYLSCAPVDLGQFVIGDMYSMLQLSLYMANHFLVPQSVITEERNRKNLIMYPRSTSGKSYIADLIRKYLQGEVFGSLKQDAFFSPTLATASHWHAQDVTNLSFFMTQQGKTLTDTASTKTIEIKNEHTLTLSKGYPTIVTSNVDLAPYFKAHLKKDSSSHGSIAAFFSRFTLVPYCTPDYNMMDNTLIDAPTGVVLSSIQDCDYQRILGFENYIAPELFTNIQPSGSHQQYQDRGKSSFIMLTVIALIQSPYYVDIINKSNWFTICLCLRDFLMTFGSVLFHDDVVITLLNKHSQDTWQQVWQDSLNTRDRHLQSKFTDRVNELLKTKKNFFKWSHKNVVTTLEDYFTSSDKGELHNKKHASQVFQLKQLKASKIFMQQQQLKQGYFIKKGSKLSNLIVYLSSFGQANKLEPSMTFDGRFMTFSGVNGTQTDHRAQQFTIYKAIMSSTSQE